MILLLKNSRYVVLSDVYDNKKIEIKINDLDGLKANPLFYTKKIQSAYITSIDGYTYFVVYYFPKNMVETICGSFSAFEVYMIIKD